MNPFDPPPDDELHKPGFGGLGGWRGKYDEPGSPDYTGEEVTPNEQR